MIIMTEIMHVMMMISNILITIMTSIALVTTVMNMIMMRSYDDNHHNLEDN